LHESGKRLGFDVADTESIQVQGQRVSSTLIREALAAGDMASVHALLGRPYSICGRIVHGAKLGKNIGFPTANLRLMRKKTPVQGVFAVTMTGIADRPIPGVANVGMRPTVEHEPEVLLETHLFDFNGDLYGRLVEVHFHAKLRDEQRFESLDALVEQIRRDASAARSFFTTVDFT
jgi:riboflavin kinase/FMN adenylyltransferase